MLGLAARDFHSQRAWLWSRLAAGPYGMRGTSKACWPLLVYLPEKLRGVRAGKEGTIIWHSSGELFTHIQFVTEREGNGSALN